MRLSVVVPCHNAASYLAQTIGSALDQSCPPDEIVIVDDASADDSLAVARQLEAGSKRIRVYEQAFRSAARTRNFGAEQATGDLIMFLDADDVLGAGALANLQEALSGSGAGPAADIAAVPWRRLDLVEGEWVDAPPSCAARRPGETPLSAWLRGCYYPPCAVMWRRESFSRFGPWPEQLRLGVNDDGLLMMRALCRGADFRERMDGVSYYRRLPASGSLSSRRREREGLLDRAEVLAEVRGCLKETGQLRGCRKSLRSAYLTLAADAAGQDDLIADYRARAQDLTDMSMRAGDVAAGALRRLRAAVRVIAPPPAPERQPVSGRVVNAGLAKAEELLTNSAGPAG